MNVVITGAGRGLGLGFVRHYLDTGDAVWACYRRRSEMLERLADAHPEQLHILEWDVTTPCPDLDALPRHIDLLINNAGIYGPDKSGQSLEQITPEVMQQLFSVNCIAPLRVVQQLRHALVEAGGIVANISSKMGSVADNSSGGTYGYRASKCALTMVSRSMAVDLAPQGVHVITLHPGWVRTDMTHHTGLIEVDESIRGMTSVLSRARDYEPGAFIAFDGKLIPY